MINSGFNLDEYLRNMFFFFFMHVKYGMMTDAHILFDEMSEKTTVGWNSIIVGYALHGCNGKH